MRGLRTWDPVAGNLKEKANTGKSMRPCIVGGGPLVVQEDYDERIASDAMPRIDYVELVRALDAEIGVHPLAQSKAFGPVRRVERKLSLDLTMAASVAHRAQNYSVIVSLAETVGIPLAGAMRLLGKHTPQVLIGHKLSWRVQKTAWRAAPPGTKIGAIACVSQAQTDYAKSRRGLGVEKSYFIADKVDERFYRPISTQDEGYVIAVGQEQRDYVTLVRALQDTDIRIVIIASSPWATRKVVPEGGDKTTVLSNVTFTRLRDLYAAARLVVVPVNDVDYAAGVNALLEGMAMARPIVCSDTLGLRGYAENGVTADLVRPGDAGAMRDAVMRLWNDPSRRSSLACAGRAAVEATMTFDHYVDNLARIAREVEVAR
ncbi:MAG TPA: glycosyltransferase family 4 protein [Polyangiaceae bacterium]